MEFEVADFNRADEYYGGQGMSEWADLETIITEMPLFLQGSLQAGKGGLFPSSNSSLYYEQARAQLAAATQFNAFTIPIRLVGLTIKSQVDQFDAVWTEYTD